MLIKRIYVDNRYLEGGLKSDTIFVTIEGYKHGTMVFQYPSLRVDSYVGENTLPIDLPKEADTIKVSVENVDWSDQFMVMEADDKVFEHPLPSPEGAFELLSAGFDLRLIGIGIGILVLLGLLRRKR